MVLRRLSLVALVMVLLVLAGCASNNADKFLDQTLRSYAATLRWQDFRAALQFVHPDQRPEASQLGFLLNRYAQVKVTGYEAVAVRRTGEQRLEQQVQIRLANVHTATERVVNSSEIWEWDEEEERWWLITGLPDISRR